MGNSPEQEAGSGGRTALVTGGASGIGRAIVELLVARGWRVHVADASADALERLRPWASARQAGVSLHLLDVRDEQAVIDAVSAASALPEAPLKAVVNSAGIGLAASFLETSLEQFSQVLDVNLLGTFRVCQVAARVMARGGGGAIVNISSGSGLRANQGRAAYGASKAAVEMLSKVMAVELAADSVRVNTVAPGPIETPLVAQLHTAEFRRNTTSVVPMRRYGRPEDIAQAVLFLLDDETSSYVTGETLCVDGGFGAAGQFG
ncbi:MAG: SDR family oxidoreductase [Burkholderiaceae bacterium]|nr:SDR family oxidoreductase [Burkholderiaceae bacterium]